MGKNTTEKDRAYITIKDVCEKLSIGRTLCNDLIKANEFTVCKFGRATRILKSSFEEYCQRSEIKRRAS